MVARGKPRRLGVRNQRGLARTRWGDQRLFVLDGTDHESLVLGTVENLPFMKTVESFG